MKVGNYQFKLKKIKFMEALSEETNCFSAILYVNGQQLAHCKNTGHGPAKVQKTRTGNRRLPEDTTEN